MGIISFPVTTFTYINRFSAYHKKMKIQSSHFLKTWKMGNDIAEHSELYTIWFTNTQTSGSQRVVSCSLCIGCCSLFSFHLKEVVFSPKPYSKVLNNSVHILYFNRGIGYMTCFSDNLSCVFRYTTSICARKIFSITLTKTIISLLIFP